MYSFLPKHLSGLNFEGYILLYKIDHGIGEMSSKEAFSLYYVFCAFQMIYINYILLFCSLTRRLVFSQNILGMEYTNFWSWRVWSGQHFKT